MATERKRKNPDTEDIYAYLSDLRNQECYAQKELEEKCAVAENNQKLYNEAVKRESALKQCWESISLTNQLAKNVIGAIECNTTLVSRVACNGELTVEAVKVLIVDAEHLAKKLLYMDEYARELKEKIDCLDPKPAANGKIMVELNKVCEAIAVALATVLDTICKLLEVLQCAEVLGQYLGDTDCSYGLTKTLVDLLNVIHISGEPGSKIKFPREDCPKDFFDVTDEEYKKAQQELADKFNELNESNEEKALSQAEKDAITKSKTAAEAAYAC